MFGKYILYQYTANDEEPNCLRCDHVCDRYDCCNLCGSEHWWNGYIRTERVLITEEERQRGLEILKRLNKMKM